MSRTTKAKTAVDRQLEEKIVQFCSITDASPRDARRFLEKYKRLDLAIDAYYSDPTALQRASSGGPSTSKLNALYDQFKDPDGDLITVDGTIRMCQEWGVDPEDVVLLAVAYELKSPRVGEWNRPGWLEGWKNIGCDTISTMQFALTRLRDKLGSDPAYFQKVYAHTFDFGRSEGARSLTTETACAFWALLIPHGLEGGALAHVVEGDEDVDMVGENNGGWKADHTQWWFEFLNEKYSKGVSKDTWMMFLDFVRTIDAKFEKYDVEAAWPSTIDDFVEYAKGRLNG